jgi:hypothetical protein
MDYQNGDIQKMSSPDFLNLCPYIPGSIMSIEWWRGWYEAAKYDWYYSEVRLEEKDIIKDVCG